MSHLQQPIQDRISSNKVPNMDNPRSSKNVGRMARLLFKITNSKTAIFEAAERGDAILVERLLDKGAAVGGSERARGGGQAAARDGQGRRRLRGYDRSDAAVVGGRERARGGGQAAARDGQGRRRLRGYDPSDAAVVGGRERARGGGQA